MSLFKNILIGLVFVSVSAFAEDDEMILRLALQSAALQPEQVMEQSLEKYPGFIEEFSIDEEDGRMIYEISIISPETGRRTEIEIDMLSGKTLEVEEEKIRSWNATDKTFSKARYQQLVSSKVSLQTAVSEAQKLFPGQLIEAELEDEKGIVFFEIEMLSEDNLKTIVVDIKTGKPIPVARGHYGHGAEDSWNRGKSSDRAMSGTKHL